MQEEKLKNARHQTYNGLIKNWSASMLSFIVEVNMDWRSGTMQFCVQDFTEILAD